jgi:hypothetical protein
MVVKHQDATVERPRHRYKDYIVTNMTTARQRIAKHVLEPYAVIKNRRPLLDNGFGYHGIRHVPVTTRTTATVLVPFKVVISTRFAQGYKRRPDETKRQSTFEAEKVNQLLKE